MHTISAGKPLGLLSLLILASGLLFLVIRWPQSKHATFSQHAAARKTTILYYVALFAVALPLLSIFFITWLVPRYQLSAWFIVLAITSELLQHSVTIIPEVGGWKTRWHRFLTGCSAILLLPMLLLVLLSSHVSHTDKLVTLSSLLLMMLIVFYSAVNRKKIQNQLLLQTAYYGAFFVAIMIITYLN